MGTLTTLGAGAQTLQEMQEFAQFPAPAQRYIRRSIEACFAPPGRVQRLARNQRELQSIEIQTGLYANLAEIEAAIPVDDEGVSAMLLANRIVPLAAFDLAEGKIKSFAAFRFLYERLLGAAARPWLLGIFTLCAALPHRSPSQRLGLLKSVDQASAGTSHWSMREPRFFPRWVERLDE